MENLTTVTILIAIGLIVAIIFQYFILKIRKETETALATERKFERKDLEQMPIINVPVIRSTNVDFGIWQGVKFGFGLGIGFILVSIIFWITVWSLIIVSLNDLSEARSNNNTIIPSHILLDSVIHKGSRKWCYNSSL